ncbi:hypothetical protein BRUCa_1042 [Brucella melitensis]
MPNIIPFNDNDGTPENSLATCAVVPELISGPFLCWTIPVWKM